MTESVLLAAVLVVLVIILVRISRPGNVTPQLMDLKNRMNDLQTRQLETSQRSLEHQKDFYQKSQQMLGEVHQKLGYLAEASRHIEEIGKDISSLQNILRAPKLRGRFGEYLLEDLLTQILPAKHFRTQYQFRNGTQVDAVIRLEGGLVPIDSKFPLESFQRLTEADCDEDRIKHKREFLRTVKLRIDEIAGKYINPEEDTFEFALMYIPAENVFYEIIVKDDLTDKNFEIFNYALERRVIPVSPNSFYSYLMAIVYGLKGLKIEQRAREIVTDLSGLQARFADFYSDFTVLGRHLRNAAARFEEAQKKADKFDDQVARITGIRAELDPPQTNEEPERS